MWSLCQCEGQNLAKMLEFLQTNIPDSQRTGLYLPTYDCMKKYQGAWHMEQKPIFSQAFLIETAEKDRLQELLGQWQPTADMSRSIAEKSIELLPGAGKFSQRISGRKTASAHVQRTYPGRTDLYYGRPLARKGENDPQNRPS